MSKKNNLLGATSPSNLREIALGSFLAFFVFIGSFIVGDSAFYLLKGKSSLMSSAFGCSSWGYCLDEESDTEDDDVPGDTSDDYPSDPYGAPPVDQPTREDQEEQARINDALREQAEREQQARDELNSVPTDTDGDVPNDTPTVSVPPTSGGN